VIHQGLKAVEPVLFGARECRPISHGSCHCGGTVHSVGVDGTDHNWFVFFKIEASGQCELLVRSAFSDGMTLDPNSCFSSGDQGTWRVHRIAAQVYFLCDCGQGSPDLSTLSVQGCCNKQWRESQLFCTCNSSFAEGPCLQNHVEMERGTRKRFGRFFFWCGIRKVIVHRLRDSVPQSISAEYICCVGKSG